MLWQNADVATDTQSVRQREPQIVAVFHQTVGCEGTEIETTLIETTLDADVACSQSCAEDQHDEGTLLVYLQICELLSTFGHI